MWAEIVHWSSFFRKRNRQQRENKHHPLETCDSSGPLSIRYCTFKVEEENSQSVSPLLVHAVAAKDNTSCRDISGLCTHLMAGIIGTTSREVWPCVQHTTVRKKRIYTATLRNTEFWGVNRCRVEHLNRMEDGKRGPYPGLYIHFDFKNITLLLSASVGQNCLVSPCQHKVGWV